MMESRVTIPPLNKQDAHLDVILVPLLHDGWKVAGQSHLVQAF